MKTILRAARCVAAAIALFTAADVVADDDGHGLNHYILDLISNTPVIGSGTGSARAAGAAVIDDCSFRCPWGVWEIYSNADGSVQFLVLGSAVIDGISGNLSGKTLIATDGSSEHAFTFPADSSDALYASDKLILVGTQGFADLGVIKPDFIVPNGFLFLSNGSLRLREEPWWMGDSIHYGTLPADGVSAFYPDPWGDDFEGVDAAEPINSARQYYVFTSPAPTPNYEGTWWDAAESGWGIGLTHQGDRIFAIWFTYDTDGNPMWLSMLASRDPPESHTYSGPLYVNTGAPFGTASGATTTTQVGTGSLAFSDADTAYFSYEVNGIGATIRQTKAITRYQLGPGPQPFCTTNFQGLWWIPAEPGKGVTIAHQGRKMFATWYTYDTNGKPLWLSALLSPKDAINSTYAGPLTRTYGPRFDNYDPSAVAPAQVVGAVTIAFDGGHAGFTYSTNGNGGLPAVAGDSKVMTHYSFAAPAGTICQY